MTQMTAERLASPASAISAPSAVNDFVSVAEAAKLTGISARHWRRRCQHQLAGQGLARLADGGWLVSRSVDARLAVNPDPIARDQLADLSTVPVDYAAAAQQRLRWVKRYHAVRRDHDRDADALAAVAAEAASAAEAGNPPQGGQAQGRSSHFSLLTSRFTARTLRAWRDAYAQGGILALVPKYGSQPPDSSGAASAAGRSADAIAFFYSLYHTQQRLSVVTCHEMTRRQARRSQHKGGGSHWSWPASCAATRKWLAKHDDLATTYLMRWGYRNWAHRYRPYLEQNYGGLVPGEIYVADTHDAKWFCRDSQGKAVRPRLVAVEDMASRCIVGWHLEFGANQDTILLALRRAFRDFAVPTALKIDNGKDYSARLFHGFTKADCRRLRQLHGRDWRKVLRHAEQRVDCDRPEWGGLLPELGIRVIFAHPYEPQSKMVERWFRTLTDRFARTIPGFCDTSPEQKTEALADRIAQHPDELLTLEECRRRLADYVGQYHTSVHGSLNGATPADHWAKYADHLRKADEKALDLMLQVRGVRRVRANGVEVSFGRPYRYGQFDPRLKRWKGRDVLVACDPQDAGFVLCLECDSRRLICRAASNEQLPAGTTGEDLRAANRQLGSALKDAKRAQATAVDRLRTPERIAAETVRDRQAAALAATGTDDAHPHGTGANFIPVQTGFEAASQAALKGSSHVDQSTVEVPSISYSLSDLLAGGGDEEVEPTASWTEADLIRNRNSETELGEPDAASPEAL